MKKIKKLLFLLSFIFLFSFINGDKIREGKASWYGKNFHGKKTASGEKYDMNAFTCAAIKDYPFFTLLRVTNVENNKSIDVYVNDRGGFKKYGRTIDLSKGAFEKISDLKKGVINVKIEILDENNKINKL